MSRFRSTLLLRWHSQRLSTSAYPRPCKRRLHSRSDSFHLPKIELHRPAAASGLVHDDGISGGSISCRHLSIGRNLDGSPSSKPTDAPRPLGSAASKPGLFSVPGLHNPSDFLALASSAMDECNDYRALLSAQLSSSTTAHTAAAAIETLHVLDDISNSVCSVIDAAELCRSAHASPKWREAADRAFGVLSSYIAELNGDDTLYRALVSVTSSPHFAAMSEEERRVGTLLQGEFERDGIHLPPEKREEVRQTIGHVTQLEGLFNQNITSGRKLFDLDAASVEKVIPRHILVEHVPQSPDAAAFGSDRVTVSTDAHIANALLKYSADPDLRREVYVQMNTACPENLDVLDALIARRRELATKLGFPSYAHRFLRDKMARSPENVSAFLDRMGRGCERRFKEEMRMISRAKGQVEGAGDDAVVEAWDVPFYSGVLKAQRQQASGSGEAVDVNEVGGYFTVENCLDGMAVLVERLFDIGMVEAELTDEERWDVPDGGSAAAAAAAVASNNAVRKFEFHHDDEGPLGTLYLDLHPREGKYAHAAHFTVRCGCAVGRGSGDSPSSTSGTSSSGEYQLPIVALVCNLSPPYSNVGSAALLSHSEVETLFHEFGHALHSLLSRTAFQHLSGTRAAMDFIETPSHLLESYAWDPLFLEIIGRHHSTGDVIPPSTVAALIESRHAFKAIEVQTQIVYARFDQAVFGPQDPSGPRGTAAATTTDTFARLHREHSVPYAEGTHWHSRFGHLVTYGAGYYGYLYAQVFASDIWRTCFASDPLSRSGGTKLWRGMLRHGGAKDPNAMLRSLLGRDPRVGSFFDQIC